MFRNTTSKDKVTFVLTSYLTMTSYLTTSCTRSSGPPVPTELWRSRSSHPSNVSDGYETNPAHEYGRISDSQLF